MTTASADLSWASGGRILVYPPDRCFHLDIDADRLAIEVMEPNLLNARVSELQRITAAHCYEMKARPVCVRISTHWERLQHLLAERLAAGGKASPRVRFVLRILWFVRQVSNLPLAAYLARMTDQSGTHMTAEQLPLDEG
ncbi:MAG: hypothetical protein WBB85_22755, partial [Albidovulum sp.]|uniref:hypothetical protein n=1 Tax=Albidovulum sp. TaxID=1872424 RepID=UPI003CB621F0